MTFSPKFTRALAVSLLALGTAPAGLSTMSPSTGCSTICPPASRNSQRER